MLFFQTENPRVSQSVSESEANGEISFSLQSGRLLLSCMYVHAGKAKERDRLLKKSRLRLRNVNL
jgi:hypothetical protein